ncbi:MAG TPA: caspase family protein, partial [Pyrinomonadaceae bacterium]|nr:caspase family protein [Pyrinomonadaceae bacterium]
GTELRTIRGLATGLFSKSFNGNDQIIFSGKSGNEVKLWDLGRGEVRTLAGHESGIFSSVFSPDGRVLASAGTDNSIRLWDTGAGAELHKLEWRSGVTGSLVFSPDGKIIAGASADKHIALWEVSSGKFLGQLAGHRGGINSLAFSPNGRTLASGSYKEVKLWDLETRKELVTLPGHFNNVNTIVFSPDGKLLASDSLSELYIWDTVSGAKLRSIRANNNELCTFGPDGKSVFSGTINSEIKEWEISTGKELRSFRGHNSAPLAFTFSSDRKLMASGSADNTIKLWHAETATVIHTLAGHAGPVHSVVFNADNRLLISAGDDGTIKVWATDSGKELATLISFGERDWMVITPDGLFDGSVAAWKQVVWRFNNETMDHAPVEAFFNEFFYPGLLMELLSGKRPLATQSLATKDRRQPQLILNVADNATTKARDVQVTIDIAEAPADPRQQTGSGARDVRLFRNGTLVKLWRGNAFELGDQDGCKQQGQGKAVCIATVTLVAGENQLLAYAFNNDNVKSADEMRTLVGGANLGRRGRAYVLAVGIDKYANPDYELRYAVADAREFGLEIRRQQERLKNYEEVEVVTLYDREATKENILLALHRLSGGEIPVRRPVPEAINRFARAEPEDLVVIYFAGHGTAHDERFYLMPHDFGYKGSRRIDNRKALQLVLAHSISDRELEAAFEKIDARHLMLIVDACNSGQALEAEEKRRGPMNSKGLAQLAYEKGMYILTAAQSYQAALEVSELGHGLLTYALVAEGLKKLSADRDQNGEITQREWLDYAVERVPRMQLAKMKQREVEIGQGRSIRKRSKLAFVTGDEKIADPEKRSLQRPRVFYRRELEASPLIIATEK